MKKSDKLVFLTFLLVVAMATGGIVLDCLTCWPGAPTCTTQPAAIFVTVLAIPAIASATYGGFLEKEGK